MTYPSYEQFMEINKQSKLWGGATECRVTVTKNMSSIENAVCNMTVYDNTTQIKVHKLVEDVFLNGMGVIKNASALRNWDGWGKTI